MEMGFKSRIGRIVIATTAVLIVGVLPAIALATTSVGTNISTGGSITGGSLTDGTAILASGRLTGLAGDLAMGGFRVTGAGTFSTTGDVHAQNVSATGTVTSAGTVVNTAQAFTVADDSAGTNAPGTLTPTSSFVEMTCNDTQACDITLDETGAADGQRLQIVNVSAKVGNFADTSGVSETTGAVAVDQYDSISFVYASDRWIEVSASNN